MKNIPNLLSMSRFPLATIVFLLIDRDQWLAAVVVFAVALVTDMLDGWLARKYMWQSDIGKNLLEPVCDLALSSAVVVALALNGVWSWWLVAGIVAVMVALQLISYFGNRNQFMRRLKRHQHYLHPLFFVVVVLAAFLSTLWQASHSPLLVVTVGAAIAVALYWKRDRAQELLVGP